jgi:hypothetical protein
MACPSYGSSSEVALFYCLDPDPAADLPAVTTFMPVPYTGESLDASLSSTISEQITPQRSYANSKLSQGEVGGSISFEASPGAFLENMLLAAMQVNLAMLEPGDVRGATNWEGAAAIKNGSTKHCLAFLKRVQNAAGNYDLYLYRGCQVDSLSLNMEPGNLVTGDINVMGTGLGNPVGGTSVWENIAAGAAPLDQWVLTASFGTGNLLSGVDSLKDFTMTNTAGDMGIVAQSVSLTLSNQLRQQYGVGTGSIYAAGVASGRFMASMSVSAYYANPKIFSSFTEDDTIAATFGLKDSTDLGFTFEFNKCKITSGSSPLAGGPDQDLLIATELRAFEDDTDGTAKITLDLVAA